MDERTKADIVARIPELGELDGPTLDRVLRVLRPLDAGGRDMSGMERINTLLDVPHPERFVPALPTQELYFFLQDVGVSDCTELVRYASKEQLAGFVDLSCWEKDRFSVDRFKSWFDIVGETTYDQVDRFVAAVDPELLVLVLKRSAGVYDVREAPEDVPEDELMFPSPDGAFRLVMMANDDNFPMVRKLLAHLYHNDIDKGRRLLQACRWELKSPLEENCYQWRTGRAADMGFLPVDEAVEIERHIDIPALEEALSSGAASLASGNTGEPSHPFTGWFLTHPAQGIMLGDVLARMPAGEARDAVTQGLVHLLNRRLSIRGLDLAEWSLVGEEMEHVFRMVSIGLERLLPAAKTSAEELLGTLPLLAFYRTGATELRGLTKRANDIQKRGAVLPGQNPFDNPTDLWLEGLRATPPRRYAEPEPGGSGDMFDPLATLAHVNTARDMLDEAEAVLALFEQRWGWSADRFEETDLAGLTEAQRTEIRFSSLLLTGLANGLLGRSADFQPLGSDDVTELLHLAFVGDDEHRRIDPVVRKQVLSQATGLASQGGAQEAALSRFVERALDQLEDTLAHLPQDSTPDTRFLGTVLLTK